MSFKTKEVQQVERNLNVLLVFEWHKSFIRHCKLTQFFKISQMCWVACLFIGFVTLEVFPAT